MSFLERPCPTCIKRDTSYSRSCFCASGWVGAGEGVCGRRILADLDSQRAEQARRRLFRSNDRARLLLSLSAISGNIIVRQEDAKTTWYLSLTFGQ
jgi:hypothetical protein